MTAVSALLSSSDFARLALEHVLVVYPDAHAAIDGDTFAIRWSREQHAGVLALGNHFAEYIDSPQRLGAVLSRIAGNIGVVEMSSELAAVQSMVIPRVRTRHHFDVELPRLIAQLEATQPGAKPRMLEFSAINEHLAWCVALDMPAHIREVDAHQLKTDRASLEALAMSNLRERSSTLTKFADGVYCGDWGDEFAASRMLMPELFTELELRGNPVLIAPGPEAIYIVGSRDAAGLLLLRQVGEQRLREPRALSGAAFELVDGAWRNFARSEVVIRKEQVELARGSRRITVAWAELALVMGHVMELGTEPGAPSPELYIMPPPDTFQWARLESNALKMHDPALEALDVAPRRVSSHVALDVPPLTAQERKGARRVAVAIVLLIAVIAACEYLRHH